MARAFLNTADNTHFHSDCAENKEDLELVEVDDIICDGCGKPIEDEEEEPTTLEEEKDA